MERQSHGLAYEDQIIERHGLLKSKSYTATFDAFNPRTNRPVSIKTKKIRSKIELGSWAKRRHDIDFEFCIGFWDREKNNIIREEHLIIDGSKWIKQFPDDVFPLIERLFRDVSSERSYDPIWRKKLKDFKEEYNDLASKNSLLVTLNPKRDHKGQLRMQCSIRLEDLLRLTAD